MRAVPFSLGVRMRALLSAIVVASIVSLVPHSAYAQLVVGFKYQYNEKVDVDTGRAPWSKFVPVGPTGGGLQACLSWSPLLVGLPDYTLYAPSWEQRKTEIYLWYTPSKAISHAQVIRHEAPLPIRDTSGTGELVIDPLTPLTGHTILLVDFGDSTITAYNRRGGLPQRGVVAKLADVRTLPIVQETFGQIDESRDKCQKRNHPE